MKNKKRWTEKRWTKKQSCSQPNNVTVTSNINESLDFPASAKNHFEYIFDGNPVTIIELASYVKSDFGYFYRDFYSKPTFTQHYYAMPLS